MIARNTGEGRKVRKEATGKVELVTIRTTHNLL